MSDYEYNDITERLRSRTPELSHADREMLFACIESSLENRVVRAIRSPYVFFGFSARTLTALTLSVVLVCGGGGTVLASDASKPGDILFPIDRAVESLQLRFARTDVLREKIRERFDEERLYELREIIADDEIQIFETSTSSTQNTTRVRTLNQGGEERVGIVVGEILDYLDESKNDAERKERLLKETFGEIDDFSLGVHVEDNSEGTQRTTTVVRNERGKSRIEIQKGDERVRIERTRGVVRVFNPDKEDTHRDEKDDTISDSSDERNTKNNNDKRDSDDEYEDADTN